MAISNLSPKHKEDLIETKAWHESCPVPLDRLKIVRVSYLDFNGDVKDDGEITVFDAIAPAVENVFAGLMSAKFPINKVCSITEYKGDDKLSMKDNNSSCFNHRLIPNSSFVSLHSYGMAIDINPLQNPFLEIDESSGRVSVSPEQGWRYLNRRNLKPGMVDELVPLFEQQGFLIWGGQWTTPIDYHHFQVSRGLAELLCVLSPEDGAKVMSKVYSKRKLVLQLTGGKDLSALKTLCQTDKSKFVENIFDYAEKHLL